MSSTAPERGELVHCAVAEGVATITLDSPHNRNALSRQLVSELSSLLSAVSLDTAVKVIVLASTDRTFCSGADLSEAATTPMLEGARAIIALQRSILETPQPVVVALQGAVRAGGTGLIAAADIVIASEAASFQFTEVKLGLAAAAISLTVLPRMTSRSAALTFLTGARFSAADAAAYGLITSVVPAEDLDAEVATVVAELRTGALQGLRETKKVLNAPILAGIDARGDELAALSARLFESPEAHEALTAFLSR